MKRGNTVGLVALVLGGLWLMSRQNTAAAAAPAPAPAPASTVMAWLTPTLQAAIKNGNNAIINALAAGKITKDQVLSAYKAGLLGPAEVVVQVGRGVLPPTTPLTVSMIIAALKSSEDHTAAINNLVNLGYITPNEELAIKRWVASGGNTPNLNSFSQLNWEGAAITVGTAALSA